VNQVGQIALSFLGQSVLILGLGIVIAKAVRAPQARVAVLRYAFLGLLTILALRAVAPGISNPWLSSKPKPAEIPVSYTPPVAIVPPVTAPTKYAFEPPKPQPPATAAVTAPQLPKIDLFQLLAGAWLLGTALLLGRVVAGTLWLRRLRRSATSLNYSRVGDLLARLTPSFKVENVDVASSPLVNGSPFVAGLRKPTVYLPTESSFSDEEMEAILSHELAHVRSKDPLWALVTQVIVAIVWPNPLAWLARRQMSFAAEERCDLMVLNSGAKPAAYAECLVQIAERSSGQLSLATPGVRMFSSQNHLAKRISLLFESNAAWANALPTSTQARVALGAGAVALASCLLVPAPAHSNPDKTSHGESYPTSKKDLDLIKASGLPYLNGDFTLVYHMVRQDLRSDEQRQAEFDHDRIRYEADIKRAEDKGQITAEEAKTALASFTLSPRPNKMETNITVSSRNGLVLYKQEGKDSVLLTKNRVYFTNGDHNGMAATDLNILNWCWIPMPAAGFAHFPISYTKVDTSGPSATIPDFPYFSSINGFHETWEGGVVSDLIRSKGLLRFEGEGKDRHLAQVGTGRLLEYKFDEFVPLKGIKIASKYTRYWGGCQHDYTLLSASEKALPDAEFEPGQMMRGRDIYMQYMGRRVSFIADPKGSDFQKQLDQQVGVSDARTEQIRRMRAESDRLDAIPGQAPDIMPLFKQALGRARSKGKVVLAISTATTCAPCHMLQRMLDDPAIKPIIDKHYEVLWIDCGEQESAKKFEHKNGTKLCKQLGIWTGFPSYAAVAPTGKVLVTVGTNGYPDDARGDEKLFQVLNAGSGLLSKDERATIQGYLNAHR